LLLAACLLLTPSTVHASADLGRIDLGSYVTGPKITQNDLKGRFVIVDFWGVNCGPCLAAIPHVTKLAEEYGHKRLVIVANHAQDASDGKVKEVWNSRAKSGYVAVVNRGNLPGFDVSRIPAAIMFDPNGKEIWRGSPTQVDKPLAQAMRNFRFAKTKKEETKDVAPAPDPIVTGIEAQYFKREIETINKQSASIGASLAKLRRAVERARKEDQKAEAGAVLAAVTQWAQTQQRTIGQALADDPATAYALNEKSIELFGRDDLAGSFVETKTKMESDDALMDRVRSTRMLRKVMAEAQSIGLTQDTAKAKSDRKNSRAVRLITRDLGRLIKAYPETDAGQEAKTLQSGWGLDG